MMAVTHSFLGPIRRWGQLLAVAVLLAGQTAVAAPPAIDGDLPPPAAATGAAPATTPAAQPASRPTVPAATPAAKAPAAAPATSASGATSTPPAPSIDIGAPLNEPIAADAPTSGRATYQKDDLIGAAEGVFGKGAAGLATMIADLLEKQGEPNGYIVGREGGGAFIFGLRYGSGTLHHKIEGTRPVYWTGPSAGIDVGANAASSFVLIYNLFDTEDLFKRFGAGEGQAYLVGGFHVSFLRRGDIVLIPVRSGAGLRLGINAGYLKFSQSQKWLPF